MTDRAMDRFPTGIPGLDTVLDGGVFRGGIYIVQGTPGAGKTIFGNQLCFNHVRAGGKALFVTLLTESHTRLLGHLSQFSFFDEGALPDRVAYLSAFRILEENGLKGLTDMLRREIRARGISLLILDGLVSAEETAGTPREFKKFIHELQTQAGLTDCTMVLLTSAAMEHRFVAAEHTMVDGLFELQTRMHGRRAERELQVHKMRGTSFLGGTHSARITKAGIAVHPRIEALYALPSAMQPQDGAVVSTGVVGLDTMLDGGLRDHSVTLALGPAGSGKTTLGLHFLGEGEGPSLLFGFNETPPALRSKAERLGLPVARRLAEGRCHLMWHPATEGVIDEIAARLVDTVRREGIRRVVIDGIDGFELLTDEKARVPAVLAALTNELRGFGATTLALSEMDIAGIVPGQPLAGLTLRDLSPVADNVLVLRLAAVHARTQRLLAVMKARDTAVDMSLRRYTLTDRGVAVDHDPESAERFLEMLGREYGGLRAATPSATDRATGG